MKLYPDVDFSMQKPEITSKQQSKKLTKNAIKLNLLQTKRIANAEI